MPDVRKLTLAEAEARVEAQPLTAELVYKPAAPLQRPGVIVDQRPKRGYRSSYDRIILVVSKATQGDPESRRARHRRRATAAEAVQARARDHLGGGGSGEVLQQKTRPGLAAAPGASRSSWLSRGAGDRSGRLSQRDLGLRVAPRLLGRDADPDPRSGEHPRPHTGSTELERPLGERRRRACP